MDGLILRSKQGLDLIVGGVDRAGSPGFILALAGQLQCGLGKRGFVVGVPDRTVFDRGFSGHTRCPVQGLSGWMRQFGLSATQLYPIYADRTLSAIWMSFIIFARIHIARAIRRIAAISSP